MWIFIKKDTHNSFYLFCVDQDRITKKVCKYLNITWKKIFCILFLEGLPKTLNLHVYFETKSKCELISKINNNKWKKSERGSRTNLWVNLIDS